MRGGGDLGQAVQEFQGRETQGGAAGEVGPWEEVEDPVDGVDADAGALPHAMHALRGGPGVEAEPSTVIPGEHVLGVGIRCNSPRDS